MKLRSEALEKPGKEKPVVSHRYVLSGHKVKSVR